jgi:hypothetical protein
MIVAKRLHLFLSLLKILGRYLQAPSSSYLILKEIKINRNISSTVPLFLRSISLWYTFYLHIYYPLSTYSEYSLFGPSNTLFYFIFRAFHSFGKIKELLKAKYLGSREWGWNTIYLNHNEKWEWEHLSCAKEHCLPYSAWGKRYSIFPAYSIELYVERLKVCYGVHLERFVRFCPV